MRRPLAALLLFGALSEKVEALDCGRMPWGWWQRAAGIGDVSADQQRRDIEARSTLERLLHTPIVFRGRVTSARYLNDPRWTNGSLIVFDHVEVLKGRLAARSGDRKAFIIQERWCGGSSCDHGAAPAPVEWPSSETFLVGAQPLSLADRSKVVESKIKRLDAVVGMCDVGRLTPMALEILNASDEEIARLIHEYEPRRVN